MRARQWVARVANWRFPGGYSGPGGTAPGQLTLHCELTEAGAATGREVHLVFPAEDLEVLSRLVDWAIIARNIARHQSRSMEGFPTGGSGS